MAQRSAGTQLAALDAHYTSLINEAVGAGRMDLVEDLARGYEDEAVQLLLTGEAGSEDRSDRPVEILELGTDWSSRRPRPSGAARFRRWRSRRG